MGGRSRKSAEKQWRRPCGFSKARLCHLLPAVWYWPPVMLEAHHVDRTEPTIASRPPRGAVALVLLRQRQLLPEDDLVLAVHPNQSIAHTFSNESISSNLFIIEKRE